MAYKVVELFAGAGGMALGFEKAGFDTALLVEWDRHACATLRQNRPNWNLLEGDVRDIDFKGTEADVVAGGFPCQSFSYAGKQKGFSDTRGTMFHEFARAVKEIRPRMLVGENVPGLMTHDGGRTLDTMCRTFEDFGYDLAVKVLDASRYGVPQTRKRVFIVGMNSDAVFWWPSEATTAQPTLREALADCPPSRGASYNERRKAILGLVPEGSNWRSLPDGIREDYIKGFKSKTIPGVARRLSWSKPSPTLTCQPVQRMGDLCHPDETRPLTVREYARIQTFPDDWEFSGPITSQYKQIGNAVPVNLGWHVGNAITDSLRAYDKASQC